MRFFPFDIQHATAALSRMNNLYCPWLHFKSHTTLLFNSFISTTKHLNNLLMQPHLECLIFNLKLLHDDRYCSRDHSSSYQQQQKWQQWYYCEVDFISLFIVHWKHETVIYKNSSQIKNKKSYSFLSHHQHHHWRQFFFLYFILYKTYCASLLILCSFLSLFLILSCAFDYFKKANWKLP